MKHLFALFMVFMLAACQTTLNNPGFTEGRYGLTRVTYQAVDDLMRQINNKGLANEHSPVLVGTFANIDRLEQTSNLGLVVSEQFTTRLVQLGYHVSDVKLRDGMDVRPEGEFVLSRKDGHVSRTYMASLIVAGTYAFADEGVMFNARITNAQTGQVLAAQDFIVERDDQINALVKDEQPETNDAWFNTNPFFSKENKEK